jgi:hypothetical protein
MYGDSLLAQALPYLRSTDEVRAYGGTVLCDWVDKIAQAATVEQPGVLVLEFVGNDLTPCMQGYTTPDQVRAKYEADMARLKRRVDAPILWVGPPKFRDQPPAALGLYSSEPRFVDAGQSVLANGTYTDTLPCLPDEGRLQGCVNGRIRVRAPDGVHFANDGSGYSAGGRRSPTQSTRRSPASADPATARPSRPPASVTPGSWPSPPGCARGSRRRRTGAAS